KLEWCERACQGRKVDVVLAEDADDEVNAHWNVVTQSLASTNRDWRHDRDKLKQAIVDQLTL
ncbi:hypothetical protein REH81_17330, partial [Vibrio rotiferianus]